MKKHPQSLARILALAAVFALPLAGQERTETRQRIEDGLLRGYVTEDGRTRVFKGIPYAAPPVGDLRWRAPQAVEPWEGVRDATQYGPRAMQGRIWDDMFFFDEGPSEDCLYLNLWIPESPRSEKLPVMFWIHGGGFIAGGTSEPRQNGEKLAQKGVLVVSVGYRMGVFGFMAHPELTNESPHDASGNYGLLDMVAALEWVRDNIAAFGGDPENVTIFGESAGSMAVSSLMASPLAEGLFHKAIGESGAAFSLNRQMPRLEEAERSGVAFAQEAFGAATLKALRAVPADALLEAAWEESRRRDFRPIVDGYFLPEPVPALFAAGEQSKVPLLAGWNRDEGGASAFLKGEEPTLETFRERAREEFGKEADRFLEAYAPASAEQVERAAADLAGDRFIGYGTWKWIETHSATGDSPVYRYRFDQALPLPEDAPADAQARAAHSWEIEYVFRVLDSKALPWRAEDYKVSELMADYWTNFAKTGNPNRPDLFEWPAYNENPQRPVLHIDASPSVESDTHRARFEFLDSLRDE